MRIACLQFNPQVGDVDNNLTRADRVLSRANPENLDLIVLPEMAFSGKCSSPSPSPLLQPMRWMVRRLYFLSWSSTRTTTGAIATNQPLCAFCLRARGRRRKGGPGGLLTR